MYKQSYKTRYENVMIKRNVLLGGKRSVYCRRLLYLRGVLARAFYILVPMQNNNVKQLNSNFHGEGATGLRISFLDLNFSKVVIDSLK